jgi:hypothetical protein
MEDTLPKKNRSKSGVKNELKNSLESRLLKAAAHLTRLHVRQGWI